LRVEPEQIIGSTLRGFACAADSPDGQIAHARHA
jgi:hypothetical protein